MLHFGANTGIDAFNLLHPHVRLTVFVKFSPLTRTHGNCPLYFSFFILLPFLCSTITRISPNIFFLSMQYIAHLRDIMHVGWCIHHGVYRITFSIHTK